MTQIIKYFRCSCSMEVLALEQDDGLVYVSIFEMQKRNSLWQRIRHCWQILTTGTPYGDSVVFDKQTVEELRNHLDEIIGNQKTQNGE